MSTVTAAARREHRVTARSLRAQKGHEPFAMLTAYDFTFARLFDLWSKRESNEIKAAQKALDGVWGVDINPFAFDPVDVPPETVLPLASSAAGQGPIQGSLLLFKIKNESFQNRPLELRFSNGGGSQEGVYDLDV